MPFPFEYPYKQPDVWKQLVRHISKLHVSSDVHTVEMSPSEEHVTRAPSDITVNVSSSTVKLIVVSTAGHIVFRNAKSRVASGSASPSEA